MDKLVAKLIFLVASKLLEFLKPNESRIIANVVQNAKDFVISKHPHPNSHNKLFTNKKNHYPTQITDRSSKSTVAIETKSISYYRHYSRTITVFSFIKNVLSKSPQ